MPVIHLYGIANCDRCRAARRWLESEGIDFLFHDLRKDGLDEEQLSRWLRQRPLNELLNRRSTTWRSLSDEDKLAAMEPATALPLICQQPTLLKRPLLETPTTLLNGFSADTYRQQQLQQETNA